MRPPRWQQLRFGTGHTVGKNLCTIPVIHYTIPLWYTASTIMDKTQGMYQNPRCINTAVNLGTVQRNCRYRLWCVWYMTSKTTKKYVWTADTCTYTMPKQDVSNIDYSSSPSTSLRGRFRSCDLHISLMRDLACQPNLSDSNHQNKEKHESYLVKADCE
jgi:hypothetical protein